MALPVSGEKLHSYTDQSSVRVGPSHQIKTIIAGVCYFIVYLTFMTLHQLLIY